ncbi:MAG: PqiC family protein [Desulfovibrionaceae bacterium]|nr:PqiC family protein [Desulfovibrionaceae bacterium]
MRTYRIRFIIKALLPVLLFMMSGCMTRSSIPSYYMMPTEDPVLQPENRTATGLLVSVGPIMIPDYLKTRSIAMRSGAESSIAYESDHLWSESMESGITRILCNTLSASLCKSGGMAVPMQSRGDATVRLSISILRFDGIPGGDTVLDATWTLYGKMHETIATGRFCQSMPSGKDLESMVRTHGALTAQLGYTLAQKILGQSGSLL